MFSPGNLDYKKTLQDLFTVTFNLMIIIILKIVAVAYSASLHVRITGICDRKEPGLVLPFLFLIWAVPSTPSALDTELSGRPANLSPASPVGTQSIADLTCPAQPRPARAEPPDITSGRPNREAEPHGAQAPAKAPGLSLLAPGLLRGVFPGTSTLPARPPAAEGGWAGAPQCG